MVYIYALELQNNKYYIGRTTNPLFRLNDHFKSNGSVWTKKHNPIKTLELIENCDNFDEDKYTLKYMEKYGINNVRGGTFCQLQLTDDNKKVIEKMINCATDKCYICGETGHYANECTNDENKISDVFSKIYSFSESFMNLVGSFIKMQNTEKESFPKDKDISEFICEDCDKKYTTLKGKNYHKQKFCKGNNIKETNIKKEEINVNDKETIKKGEINVNDKETDIKKKDFKCENCEKIFDTINGKNYHKQKFCKGKNIKEIKSPSGSDFKCGNGHDTLEDNEYHKKMHCKKNILINENELKDDKFKCKNCEKEFDTLKGKTFHQNMHCKEKTTIHTCFRCGYDGHLKEKCYAKKHIKGYFIK
jgi:hypothetical protein